jgi:hypothetical protein
MTAVYGLPRRYFNKKGTLLFTLSKRQRDLLADLPARLPANADRHLRRTAAVRARNGLICLSGDADAKVALTPAGQAAIAFYDTLMTPRGE